MRRRPARSLDPRNASASHSRAPRSTEPLSFLSVLEVTRANDPYLASRADTMRPAAGPFDGLQASDTLYLDDELDDVDDIPLDRAKEASS